MIFGVILENDSNLAAEVGNGKGAQVLSFKGDGSFSGVIESAQQFDEGGFACAVFTD
jgi:hypothetical protein